MIRIRCSLVTVALVAGCSGSTPTATGDLTLFLEAEETITAGLVPGDAAENTVDGWTVSYDRFVVAIGDVRLARSALPVDEARDPSVHVIDLATLPASGTELTRFDGLAATRWDLFSYATPAAAATAARDASVVQADFDAMIAGGCSYLIVGTVSKRDGESCPPGGTCEPATEIDFSFCVPAPTTFDHCQSPDGMVGVAITAGGTTTAALTIHGDHLWFNSFPVGDEGTIERRVQWIADSDVNHDGTVTQEELEGIDAAELFTSARMYSLTGAPIIIDDAWDFVIAQVATQGHFQGEGGCVFTPNF